MKKLLIAVLMVIVASLLIAGMAFADPNTPDPKGQAYGIGGEMGEWASSKKIMMPFYMMYLPNVGQNYKFGPSIGIYQGNCPSCW